MRAQRRLPCMYKFTLPPCTTAFHEGGGGGALDSLLIGPGAGDFPSISQLDMSLALGSFPPEGVSSNNQQAMPTISEVSKYIEL